MGYFRKGSFLHLHTKFTLVESSKPYESHHKSNASTFQLILQSCYKKKSSHKIFSNNHFQQKKMRIESWKFIPKKGKKGKRWKSDKDFSLNERHTYRKKKVGKLLTFPIPFQFRNPIKLNNNKKKKCEDEEEEDIKGNSSKKKCNDRQVKSPIFPPTCIN